MSNEYQLLVADRSGNVLTELGPQIQSVSWRLNKVGKLIFTMSTGDAKATEENLRFGNRIFIDFENGLPNWGGRIDPPRTWATGMIEITAYSGEHILSTRTTDKGRYFTNAGVGAIFQAVITEANSVAATGISVGQVWGGGNTHSPEYHYKDLLWICQQSIATNLSDADFEVVPNLSGGKITFTANLYQRKGSDKLNFAFLEGANIGNIRLSEQGPIINEWNMAGAPGDPGEDNTGWGDTRITSSASDSTSIATYGRRQGSKIFVDVSVQTTLDAHADNALAESKDPHNLLDFVSSDQDPAKFADYDIGDRLTFHAHSYGFGGTSTTVKVYGREFVPSEGICSLVVREE